MSWTTYESPDGFKIICMSTTIKTKNPDGDFSLLELILKDEEERQRRFKEDLYRQLFEVSDEAT